MARNEKTSSKVAREAAQLLRDPKSSKVVNAVAASALTQTENTRELKQASHDAKKRRGKPPLVVKKK